MSSAADKPMSVTGKFRFGAFEVDLENRELRKHGLRVRLQHKPFQILEMLLCAPGRLVSREDLARRLWPSLHVNFDRSLNTAVNALRQVLGDSRTESPLHQKRAPGSAIDSSHLWKSWPRTPDALPRRPRNRPRKSRIPHARKPTGTILRDGTSITSSPRTTCTRASPTSSQPSPRIGIAPSRAPAWPIPTACSRC